MMRIFVSLFVLAFAIAGLAMTAQAQQDPAPESAGVQDPLPSPEPSMTPCKPDSLLVKVNPGADPAEVIGRHGGTILRTISGIDVQVVAVPAGTGLQTIDELNADPDVKYAEADQIVQASQTGGGAGC
jgi:Fervidolysin N-terminal prodomain